MSVALRKAYTRGTHRIVPPETTLSQINPHLSEFGITRCADITGLDCIGIPVYVAIRPQGRVLQSANGKGMTPTDAKVSAYMEAIEHWHAENPATTFRRSSFAELTAERSRAVPMTEVADWLDSTYLGNRRLIDWVKGKDIFSDEVTWIPSFGGYYHPHLPYRFSFNGLASGNHPVEASLHALYEVIERDTLATLSDSGNVRFSRSRVINCESIADDIVGPLYEKIARAGIRLVLSRVPRETRVHTLTAVLLDSSSMHGASMVNFGAGAHLSPSVAAARAITEAAQTRLTYIHGSREDLSDVAYERGPTHETLFAYFSQLTPVAQWNEFEDHSCDNLLSDYATVLKSVRDLGYTKAYAVDLSQDKAGVSAVKVLVPGTRCPSWI